MSTHPFRLILSLILLSAVAGAADNPLTCIANAGVPPVARVEGVAEPMGTVIINCTGGTPTAAGQPIPGVNIDITLNTNVTSRLLDTSGSRSEALLLLDEPMPGEQVEAPSVPFASTVLALGTGQYKGAGRPNIFGAQQMTPASLRWANVPFDPPGNGRNRVIRLLNVRANANALGLGSPFSPSVVTMSISAGAPLGAVLANSQLTVAFVLSSMLFSTTPATYEQCAVGSRTFPIVFTELHGTAFLQGAGVTSQDVPGQIYNTESMFFSGSFTGAGAGAGKSQGTFLIARFTGVPANVTLSVPVSVLNAATGDTLTLAPSGTSGSTTNASTGIVTLLTGVGAAVWEVTRSNPGATSPITIPVTVTFAASPQPDLGSAMVSGYMGPIAATQIASTEVAPRFILAAQSAPAFTVSACSSAAVVSLSKDVAGFTATTNGSSISAPHEVTVSSTSAGVTNWSATSDRTWLGVTPASGQNNGKFTAFVNSWAIPAPGTYTGRITVTASGASTGVLYLNCTLTVTSAAAGVARILKYSGDGQVTSLYNGFTQPLVARVVDAAGSPVAGKTITWTQQGGVSFNSSTTTTTDFWGTAQIVAVPGGLFTPGTPFLAYSITATSDVGAAVFTMTSYPVTGVGNYFPPPLITLLKPAQETRTITAKLGVPLVDAVRAHVVSGGGNATNPTDIPNAGLNVSTGNTNPAAGIVARCEGGTPLSGTDGIATCNLIVEGPVGTVPLLVNVAGLRDFPGVQLTVTGGDPVAPVILQGNNQSGNSGAILPSALVARVADAYGNALPGTPVTWSVVPAGAATLLDAATQADGNGNASARVQLGSLPGAVQVKLAAGGKETVFTVHNAVAGPPVTLSLNRTALAFGALSSGSRYTPPQDVRLTMTGGSASWVIAPTGAAWLGTTPSNGVGSGTFSVFVIPSQLPGPGTYTQTISISAPGGGSAPLSVAVTLTVRSATAGPYGSFDTPVDNSTGVAGNIAVTGWALDDIGVKKVTLWRDPIGSEPRHANGYIYIADALFVNGARPDVEQANPSTPRANRGGWGYMMLTNGLPGVNAPQGNGVYRLHAFAEDEEGNSVKLGSKTITVNNLGATRPFGTLDTPTPGQVISGIFLNWGWAMTPQPGSIATNGSTIWVGVDGVNLAHPQYGLYRPDIAAAFPGYANSANGVGAYYLDTTQLSNGIHTIGWLVYDNMGRGDGIGSRFIEVQNSAPVLAASEPAISAGRAFQLRSARLRQPLRAAASYPAFRRGYDLNAGLAPIRRAGEALFEPVELNELDRVEIHLDGGRQWSALMRVGDELRDLPAGSTFDAEGGIFYWQLGPGFLGEYLLEFSATDGAMIPVTARVGVRGPVR